MNQLTNERRGAVIQALCEGNSIRATGRLTGTAKGTVLRLVAERGEACAAFHDKAVRNVPAKRRQVDGVWSFCYAQARKVPLQVNSAAGDLSADASLGAHSQ